MLSRRKQGESGDERSSLMNAAAAVYFGIGSNSQELYVTEMAAPHQERRRIPMITTMPPATTASMPYSA